MNAILLPLAVFAKFDSWCRLIKDVLPRRFSVSITQTDCCHFFFFLLDIRTFVKTWGEEFILGVLEMYRTVRALAPLVVDCLVIQRADGAQKL